MVLGFAKSRDAASVFAATIRVLRAKDAAPYLLGMRAAHTPLSRHFLHRKG